MEVYYASQYIHCCKFSIDTHEFLLNARNFKTHETCLHTVCISPRSTQLGHFKKITRYPSMVGFITTHIYLYHKGPPTLIWYRNIGNVSFIILSEAPFKFIYSERETEAKATILFLLMYLRIQILSKPKYWLRSRLTGIRIAS